MPCHSPPHRPDHRHRRPDAEGFSQLRLQKAIPFRPVQDQRPVPGNWSGSRIANNRAYAVAVREAQADRQQGDGHRLVPPQSQSPFAGRQAVGKATASLLGKSASNIHECERAGIFTDIGWFAFPAMTAPITNCQMRKRPRFAELGNLQSGDLQFQISRSESCRSRSRRGSNPVSPGNRRQASLSGVGWVGHSGGAGDRSGWRRVGPGRGKPWPRPPR